MSLMISILIQLVNLFHLKNFLISNIPSLTIENNNRTKLKTRPLLLYGTSIDSVNNKKHVTLLNNMRSKGELRLSYLSNVISKLNASLGHVMIR